MPVRQRWFVCNRKKYRGVLWYPCPFSVFLPPTEGFFDTLVAVVVMMGVPDKWILVRAHGTTVELPTQDDSGNSEVASLEGSMLKGQL
ncbi:hypothetical protein L1987_81645 [Smallanthus sonchifolius]|uniref:Uncharacterized protein n=1 Tax=Smallanthus sonchifolius TaxID=185202 RepID=A0ACB8YVA2_9ASTR|nr:hypothetical protein L1987_81645 [Smallanthus sonchifolius]